MAGRTVAAADLLVQRISAVEKDGGWSITRESAEVIPDTRVSSSTPRWKTTAVAAEREPLVTRCKSPTS